MIETLPELSVTTDTNNKNLLKSMKKKRVVQNVLFSLSSLLHEIKRPGLA